MVEKEVKTWGPPLFKIVAIEIGIVILACALAALLFGEGTFWFAFVITVAGVAVIVDCLRKEKPFQARAALVLIYFLVGSASLAISLVPGEELIQNISFCIAIAAFLVGMITGDGIGWRNRVLLE